MGTPFQTHPSRYRHWSLSFQGSVATLALRVDPASPWARGYELKLNSYDLAVDLELADAIERLRFEHPEVRCAVITSAHERAFCSGANIYMLASASHRFKVNFCKVTNETRLAMEDASERSGLRFLCAINGACAGGGYELALACDEILLIDDGSSAVSLPEVPSLGVLPGTGGLTRLVDKRKVRRDVADVLCTTAEGVRGKRALEWGLVDHIAPRSRFAETVAERARQLAASSPRRSERGIELPEVAAHPTHTEHETTYAYEHVTLHIERDRRVASLLVRASGRDPAGSWSLRAFREIDDALLRLRFDHPDAGLLVLRSVGSRDALLGEERWLDEGSWLAGEVRALQARVLRRLELTSRSMFAIAEPGSCWIGSLLELALAADRIYALDAEGTYLEHTAASRGALPAINGRPRLENRFCGDRERTAAVFAATGPIDTARALSLGLVTFAIDPVDWDDDLRVAIEERASLSPDALTGMEANLRWPGPETMASKIFGRLSAWQNWIFQRPDAIGPNGALTRYGQPERPVFDWERC